MSGVCVVTVFEGRSTPLMVSVNWLATGPPTAMRWHWMNAVHACSCSVSADTSPSISFVARTVTTPRSSVASSKSSPPKRLASKSEPAMRSPRSARVSPSLMRSQAA